MKTFTTTISLAAFEARMRRHLAKGGIYLKKGREGSRWYTDQGDYYTVNVHNAIDDSHINLIAWGRDLGILRPFEEVGE